MTLSEEYFMQLYQEAERRLERVDELLINAEKQHIKVSETNGYRHTVQDSSNS